MNDTEVKLKFTNNVSGQTKLDKYVKQLTAVNSLLNGIDKEKIQALNNASVTIQNTDKEVKQIAKDVGNMSDMFKVALVLKWLLLL